MLRYFIIVFLILEFFFADAKPQDRFYGPGYQSIILVNPASVGAEGDGVMRMIYMNPYPGRGFDLHSFSVSYDTFIPLLHGGVACFFTNDYLGGILNDIRGGFSYSYHLQAGNNLFINAGLSAAIQHRGVSRGNIILPDQIDPLRGVVMSSQEIINYRGKSFFDVGTGVMVIYGRYIAALSVNHLALPDYEGYGSPESLLKRRLSLYATATFSPAGNLDIRPLFLFDMAGKDITVAAGATGGAEPLSINVLAIAGRAGDINMQTGLSFKKGKVLFFYNYCFNLTSVNSLMPFSLYHQGGIGISLNNVNKRNVIKTINFPEL